MSEPARYDVFADDALVLEITDRPGPLTSTSTPPPAPGDPDPPDHEFLTATAHSASDEHRLRQLLLESCDTNDYLDRLAAAGYRVERPPSGDDPTA